VLIIPPGNSGLRKQDGKSDVIISRFGATQD
jgi:hypothetical protein